MHQIVYIVMLYTAGDCREQHLATDGGSGWRDRTGLCDLQRGLQVPARQGVGSLHVHKALQHRRGWDQASQDSRLQHCHTLQRSTCGLPHERCQVTYELLNCTKYLYLTLVSCKVWFAHTQERLLLNLAVIRCVL